MTLIASFGPLSLWHNDPCKHGHGDDSCGWFMRAHHGSPEMLKKIRSAMDFSFDRTFEYIPDDWDGEKKKAGVRPQSVYHTGYFMPHGDPNFSTHGIVLNLFFDAIHAYFNHDWDKSRPWMRKHLFDILMFAENPTDSLRDGIVGTFRGAEKWNREERLDDYARCIYGWILREERPWYRHPRWHVHHWSLSCQPFWKHWWWNFRRSIKKPSPNDTRYGCSAGTP